MVARTRLVRAVASGLLLAACGASSTRTVSVGVQVTRGNPSAVGTPATVGAKAGNGATPSAPVSATLQFTAARLGGGSVEGAAYAGKPVAFWFWAPG